MKVQLKRKTLQVNEKTDLRSKFKRGKKYIADTEKTVIDLENQIIDHKDVAIPKPILDKVNFLITNKLGPEYTTESLLGSFKSSNPYTAKLNNVLFLRLFDLVKYDGHIDYINTVKIINHFNSKKDVLSKVKCIRPNKNTLEFKKVSVATSHLMLRYSTNDIMKSIDRMAKHTNHSKLRFCKSITLLHFLLNPNNEEYLKIFLEEEDDGAIFSQINKIKTNYTGIQNEWKKIYMDMYLTEEDGEKYYKRNRNGLMKFVENIVESAQKENLNLCGRHFTKENKAGETAIFKEYIIYLQDKFGKKNKVITTKYIVDFSNWIDFVQERMRDEYELSGFFRPQKRLTME